MEEEDDEGSTYQMNLTSLFDDISLLQQSQMDIYDDSNTSALQTYGLDDLSCSLIHCNAKGDYADEIDKYCDEISKRDRIIVTLYNALNSFMKSREDGDYFLTSVEQQVQYVHKELHKHQINKLVIEDYKKSANESLENINVSQTEYNDFKDHLENQNQRMNKPRSNDEIDMQNNKDPLEPNAIDDSTLNDVEKETFSGNLIIPKGIPPYETISSSQTEFLKNSQEEDKSESEDELESSHRLSRLCLPVNPDSFRLTFSPNSPSIYEMESSLSEKTCHQSIIEDLKLQLNDRDRKLEATKKYLDEMTTERENERDEFQHTIEDLLTRCEEIKRERDKSETIVRQQKSEMEDMMENLVSTNRLKDQILQRSQLSDYELKRAVEKICELREMIRSLEEQVEEATKQATMFSEIKQGLAEDSITTRDNSCIEERPTEDITTPDADYTGEIHAQVVELSKRVEDKIVDLENFPWQARPGSSCSVKSGDDVSVRATNRTGLSNEDEAIVLDVAAGLTKGLRRLEGHFDTLVRFEEVLLKKVRDYGLKFSNERKKLEVVNNENFQLKNNLKSCKRKIIEFERFINEGKQSSPLFSSSMQIETMRNVGHSSFLQRFDESSPMINPYRIRGEMDIENADLEDALADSEQEEPEVYDDQNYQNDIIESSKSEPKGSPNAQQKGSKANQQQNGTPASNVQQKSSPSSQSQQKGSSQTQQKESPSNLALQDSSSASLNLQNPSSDNFLVSHNSSSANLANQKGSSVSPASQKGSSASPKGSSASPKGSSASPKGSSASPNGSSAIPKGSSAIPNGSSASPKGSSASPKDSSANPASQKSSSADQKGNPKGILEGDEDELPIEYNSKGFINESGNDKKQPNDILTNKNAGGNNKAQDKYTSEDRLGDEGGSRLILETDSNISNDSSMLKLDDDEGIGSSKRGSGSSKRGSGQSGENFLGEDEWADAFANKDDPDKYNGVNNPNNEKGMDNIDRQRGLGGSDPSNQTSRERDLDSSMRENYPTNQDSKESRLGSSNRESDQTNQDSREKGLDSSMRGNNPTNQDSRERALDSSNRGSGLTNQDARERRLGSSNQERGPNNRLPNSDSAGTDLFLETNIGSNPNKKDEDIILHEYTTVSSFEADGNELKYLGSQILPSTELNTEAQEERIKRMNDKLDLEKLKTEKDFLERTLEQERLKSNHLEEQLNMVAGDPFYGDQCMEFNGGQQSGPDNSEEARLRGIIYELQRNLEDRIRTECILRQQLDCGRARLEQIEDENQSLRETTQYWNGYRR